MKMTTPTNPKQFVLYKDQDQKWRWKLYAANSRIIADSAESYNSKADAIHGIRLVTSLAAGAGIWNYDLQQWEPF